MITILVWCEREVNTGDVEVDVGQAGEGGSQNYSHRHHKYCYRYHKYCHHHHKYFHHHNDYEEEQTLRVCHSRECILRPQPGFLPAPCWLQSPDHHYHYHDDDHPDVEDDDDIYDDDHDDDGDLFNRPSDEGGSSVSDCLAAASAEGGLEKYEHDGIQELVWKICFV